MVHEGEKEAESLDSVPLVEMYMCGTYALQNLLHLLTYFILPQISCGRGDSSTELYVLCPKAQDG